MREIPDPESGAWIRRARERASADAAELRAHPPFDLLGLAAPQITPLALAETGRVNGSWEQITLAYGDWAAPAGPYVSVASAVRQPASLVGAPEAALARALDRERNRIASHAGIDEDDPPGPLASRPAAFPVSGVPVAGLVLADGAAWAARLESGEVTVTVTGRGVAPRSVELAVVADIGPYLDGRAEMLSRMAGRRRGRPAPVLAPATGVAACRALADVALGDQARRQAALAAGREPRQRAGEGPAWAALWQRAVREQELISGAGPRHADETVALAINHLGQLQGRAPWFTAQPRLREAAIGETLRHAVLGQDVPSGPAQQAWARYWAHQLSLSGTGPGDPGGPAAAWARARHEARRELLADWERAWSDWAARA
jgi:hypothetical protein